MERNENVKAVAEKVEYSGEKSEQTQVSSGEVLLVNHDEVRHIPIPTNNPNDPLNFNKFRKLGVTITCCWFSIFSLLSVSGMGPFMSTLYAEYIPKGASAEAVTGLSTYSSLVMAAGCLVMLPLAFVIGRRPVFIFAVLLCFIANITAATSKDFDAHLTSRIFIGIATGATESLLPLILTDITFLHERSFYFGLYWSVQNFVNSALNIAISYLVAAAGWRWYYWMFVITLGISTLLVVFLAPETKFNRPATLLDGQVIFTDEFGATRVLTDPDAIAQLGELEGADGAEVPKKTFLQELKPWSDITPNGFQVWLGSYLKIGKAFTSPGVLYSLLFSSISLGTSIAITMVYSGILIEGFGWAPKDVGLMNCGVLPACTLAMFYSGYCADKINLWLAKRNGGVHKPEHHLVHLILPAVACVISVAVIAVCAQNPKTYSSWGMILGWAINQFSFTCILITTTTFAAEIIPDNPGAGVVVVVGGKNIISFAAAYGIVPMVHVFSYLKAFMILMGIFIGIAALGLPVYFLNPMWRRFTGNRKKA